MVIGSLLGLTGGPTRTGYSASKHALMGFYGSLRIELMGTGVGITMVTPRLRRERDPRSGRRSADGRPLGESPMQESKIMTAEACADMILRGMEGRKRLVIGSLRGKLGRIVRIFAPGLIDRRGQAGDRARPLASRQGSIRIPPPEGAGRLHGVGRPVDRAGRPRPPSVSLVLSSRLKASTTAGDLRAAGREDLLETRASQVIANV